MSTLTVELPEDLDRDLAASKISEARLRDFIVEAVKVWLRQHQAEEQEPACSPWPKAFEGSAVSFADKLIVDNQELFDELARR